MTVIYDPSIPFPKDFKIKIQGIVIFPPGSKGGNHKHPRIEAFYSNGDLTIIYLDKSGIKKELSMAPQGDSYKLFVTPPFLPHAVVNRTDKELILVEFADTEQHDVEKAELI